MMLNTRTTPVAMTQSMASICQRLLGAAASKRFNDDWPLLRLRIDSGPPHQHPMHPATDGTVLTALSRPRCHLSAVAP
ncbi:MAG: hypothetical protein R2711_15215 [Acidimicrobiales bacterium]